MKLSPEIKRGLLIGFARGFRIFTGIASITGYLYGFVTMEDVLNGRVIPLTGGQLILATLTLGALTLCFFYTALDTTVRIWRQK